MTLDCLRSVAEKPRSPAEVILLDNVSPTARPRRWPSIPRGAADREPRESRLRQGNNIAARAARGDYLLLLNPDTLVLDGAIDKLVAFAERTPQSGDLGRAHAQGDSTLDLLRLRRPDALEHLLPHQRPVAGLQAQHLFNPEYYGGWQRDSERAVGTIMGCFLLIRREIWEALGGFDLSFVMYGEETDLCRRARDRSLARRA